MKPRALLDFHPAGQFAAWVRRSGEGIYGFEPFELDSARRLIVCEGEPVAMTARGFDLLLLLILNRHRMLSRAELLSILWPDVWVEDANLSVNVSLLRKALGEDKRNPRFIATVPRRGYRFVAEVQLLEHAVKTRPKTPSCSSATTA